MHATLWRWISCLWLGSRKLFFLLSMSYTKQHGRYSLNDLCSKMMHRSYSEKKGTYKIRQARARAHTHDPHTYTQTHTHAHIHAYDPYTHTKTNILTHIDTHAYSHRHLYVHTCYNVAPRPLALYRGWLLILGLVPGARQQSR